MVYAYQPINPLQSFAQGFQFVEGLRGVHQQRQQAQLEQQQRDQQQLRQRDMVSDLQALKMNMTPQAIADFQLKYPEMKEPIQQYWNTLSEADKATEKEAMSEVIIAQRTGRTDQIPAILERYAVAAENARNPAMAKKFRDVAQYAADGNGDAAAETAKVRFGILAPAEYEKLFASTAAIQNYEYFKGILGPDKVEEIIGVTPKDGVQVLPNGMVIAGPDSPLAKSMSGGMGAQLPTVTSKEQLASLPEGTRFIGPDGVERVKKGGGGSNATGNFR